MWTITVRVCVCVCVHVCGCVCACVGVGNVYNGRFVRDFGIYGYGTTCAGLKLCVWLCVCVCVSGGGQCV